jgi:hypothetical protein
MTKETEKPKTPYEIMRAVNVSDKIEKKNGLSYLSWAWALDTLLLNDPNASWEFHEPKEYGNKTYQVSCTVTAFDKPRTMHLPVMDHRNKAISDPDAFAFNTAMQRCLVKCISLHGLGLYIYAGEDLPDGAEVKISDKLQKEFDDLKKQAFEATSETYPKLRAKVMEFVKRQDVPQSLADEMTAEMVKTKKAIDDANNQL